MSRNFKFARFAVGMALISWALGTVFGEGLSPALERALAQLSAAEREVIALRVLLELDGEGAARVLGISTSACSTRLSRALQKLEKEVSSGVAA